MEQSESSLTRIGRSIWTVWGYLTGAVGRYLGPEVTNEINPSAHSNDREPVITTINKSYRELKEKEEEKERSETKTWYQHERKMREVAGLQRSGLGVQTATVQWEKVSVKGDADGDHDEDRDSSKHTCSSTARSTGDQDMEGKGQELGYNKETLDCNLNINNQAKKILNTKEEHKFSPPVISNANIESQECAISGGKDPDLDANVSGTNQEDRRKSEKERSDYMMKCVVDGKEIVDSKNSEVEQGLGHEQINSCDNGDKEYIQEASAENAIDYANNQDLNVESIDEQSHQEKANNKDKSTESQTKDEDLTLLIYPSCGRRSLIKAPTNKEVKAVIYTEEVSTNEATVTPESEAIGNKETEQGTMGKIKHGQHEELSVCVAQQPLEFTGTELFDKQNVYSSKKHEAQTEHTENKIEMECELKEFVAAPMENLEISKKEVDPCSKMGIIKATLANSSLGLNTNLLTVPLKQHKEDIEVTTTSESTLKAEVMQLDDTDDISGSQSSEMVIKQGIESVIARVELEAENQSKTVDHKSKRKQDTKVEVVRGSEDVMKSTMVEAILHEHSIDREEALQEIVHQCSLEQEPRQEEPANGKINETGLIKTPFSEMLRDLRGTASNSEGHTDETAIKSIDDMSSSSLLEQDKTQCSIELNIGSTTELTAETKTEQKLLLVKHNEVADARKPPTTEVKGQQAESETDTSKTESESFIATVETSETCTISAEAESPVMHDLSKTGNLLRDQLNCSEDITQDTSDENVSYGSRYGSSEPSDLPDRESPLKSLEMWRNSQKDTEEGGTVETAPGLPDEIKSTIVLGFQEEVMSGLTKERQGDLSRQIESPDNRITEIEGVKTELLNAIREHRKDLQAETMHIGSEACGQFEVGKMAKYTRCELELKVELTEEGKSKVPHKQASVSEINIHNKKDKEENVDASNENIQKKNRPGLKRGFDRMEKGEEKDRPPVSKDWPVTDLFQVSTLDFTIQKSKIAVKNPVIRPPKDPRTLINMASVEPLSPPRPSGSSPLRKSQAEGLSAPGKGGFKLPGLGSALPVLRQTEASRKMRDKEEAQGVTSQIQDSKQKSGTDPAVYCAKQDQLHDKPKSALPRYPGMGSQQMMLELKNKLKKNKNEKE